MHTGLQNIDYTWMAGKIQTVTDWAGRAWTYGYDTISGSLNSMTGPAPQLGLPAPKVVLTYVPGTTRIASYSVTDTAATFTQTTEVAWDTHANVSQILRLDTQGTSGGARTWSFESAESRQIDQMKLADPQAALDAQDAFDQVVFPDGSTAKTQVNQFGDAVREERTVLGYLANTVITTSFTRDADGQATTAGPFEQKVGTNPATTVPATSYLYDTVGRRTLATYPNFVGATTVHTTEVWTYVGNARASNPATYKNRVGNFFSYQYNTDGFPTRIDEYASQGGQFIASTFYTWLHGRMETSAAADPTGLGGSGTGTQYYYDEHLNLTHARVTTASATGVLANPAVSDIWVSFGYDSLQNIDWMTSQYHPTALVTAPSGDLVPAITDITLLAVQTDVTTDVYGRMLTTLSPIPSSGESRLLSTMTYDAVGRLLTAVEPEKDKRGQKGQKGSATVLNNVNDRFEKRFSNSNFVQCVDRGVGFFEAWVSVFDGVLNWKSRLSTIVVTGETECGSAGTQPHEG